LWDLHLSPINDECLLADLSERYPAVASTVMRDPGHSNEGANPMRQDARHLSVKPLIALFIRHISINTFIERDNPD
jgi:hypothetical protein